MSKENKATVYGLNKGAYLINKQPQLINDRHLEGELQRSEMYFKNTKEYTKYEQADVLFWSEIEDIKHLKFDDIIQIKNAVIDEVYTPAEGKVKISEIEAIKVTLEENRKNKISNVKHYAEMLRYIIDENGNKQYFVIHPELLNSVLGKYIEHLECKLKEHGLAPVFIR